MTDSNTPKLKAEPVLEIDLKMVQEDRTVKVLGQFLADNGSLYYMWTAEEFSKNPAEAYRMSTLLKDSIGDYVRIGFPHVTSEQMRGVLLEILEELNKPLRSMENLVGQNIEFAGVEVRVTTDQGANGQNDIRVHYTVRAKDGKSLKR